MRRRQPDTAEREGASSGATPTATWTPPGTAPSQPGIGQLLTEYERLIDRLQDAEDKAQTARDYFELLNRLNPLVRSTRNLHERSQDAREGAPDDRQLLLWRDRAYVLSPLGGAAAQRREERPRLRRRPTGRRRSRIEPPRRDGRLPSQHARRLLLSGGDARRDLWRQPPSRHGGVGRTVRPLPDARHPRRRLPARDHPDASHSPQELTAIHPRSVTRG